MTTEASERVGEDPDAGNVATELAADVSTLLSKYNAAQTLVRRPPPSISLPVRDPWRRLMRAIHLRVRPTWFSGRWMARELRRRTDVLERGMAERLALGGEPTPEEVHNRDVLRHFQESLSPRLSGFVAAAVLVAGIVLAQAIINGLLAYQYLEEGDESLARALGEIGVTPDPSAITTLLEAIGNADLNVLFAFVMGLLASGYILGRAPASGYRLARLALGEPDGLGVPRRTSALGRSVEALQISATEAAVFAAIGRPRPRELPFDLAVKSLMAMGWLYVAIFSLRGNASSDDYWEFILFGALASLRLLWLARASVIRGTGLAWLTVPLVLLISVAMIAPAEQDALAEPQTAADPALSLTLSLQSDLSGVDLRNRDLTRVYLPGKNLSRANLQGTNLEEADLTGATLRGADLTDANLAGTMFAGANLRRAYLSSADLTVADLTGADLRQANLTEANLDLVALCAADLRGATLDGVAGMPLYDTRTRWPATFSPPPHDPDFSC